MPTMRGGNAQPYPSKAFSQVMLDAQDEAQKFQDEYVSVEHLYLALLKSRDGSTKAILRRNGITKDLDVYKRQVLRLRFGLDDGRARTLEEVGKEFNVTRERIRQIEAKALRKLRHPSRSKKLKDFLD